MKPGLPPVGRNLLQVVPVRLQALQLQVGVSSEEGHVGLAPVIPRL